MRVPYAYVSFCDDNPAEGRWDQAWVKRILNAEEWRVPIAVEFVQRDLDPEDPAGSVIIFPCGHYADHDEVGMALAHIQKLVDTLPWSVLIATSDEGSTFPWGRFVKPDNCRLWVMTPRPENSYPDDTFFIGEGCPSHPLAVHMIQRSDFRKDYDVYFGGQINHEPREKMQAEMAKLISVTTRVAGDFSDGFAQGLPVGKYLAMMCGARIGLCPTGPLTQDSFRFFEALEAQMVPIVDRARPDGKGEGYWTMLFGRETAAGVGVLDWGDLWAAVQHINNDALLPAKVSAWWQEQKRRVAYRLQADLAQAMPAIDYVPVVTQQIGPDEQITAIIVTSPSPLNPSTDLIEETIRSIRDRLPLAEILIGIDGPHDGVADPSHYWEYARRLCALTNPMPNVCPYVFEQHHHQSGMVRRLLDEVGTDYVMFMEHDTPLCGEIDFTTCLWGMRKLELGIVRFTHEAGVLPEHEHLFLQLQADEYAPFVGTIQYSARPHLISTAKFRDLIATYFGSKSRTFLEDTLYGALQWVPEDGTIDLSTERLRLEAVWRRHRMAVYAPPGSWKRSEHTDGRRGERKQPTWIQYDGERPNGGPPEGWMEV